VTIAAASGLEARLSQRLGEALARHRVPGAVVGVSLGDETAVAAAGVRNLRTGEPVTRESIFAIGSVTKVFQAGLLVSLGLPLDDPVRRHLPEFRCADTEAADAITIRQLLDHSSGLEGDYFPDFGWGDDAVACLVESCATIGQLHPPGLLASYCNTGVNVGGRIVEVAARSTWDEALRDRLLGPAGLHSAVSLPWEAILREIALGHVPGDGGLVVAPKWSWPRAAAPAGGTLAASAPDVLRFARLHLEGAAPIGAEVAAAMAEFQRPCPSGILSIDGATLAGMGLGWFVFDWAGTRVLGHDGMGLGCAATLRMFPDRDAAVVCLSNAWYAGYALNGEVVRGVVEDELGLAPAEEEVAANPHDATRYLGTYRRLASEIEIAERPAGLLARLRQELLYVPGRTVAEVELEPVGPDLLRARHASWALPRTYRFVDGYLYENFRAHRRDG
jgi:CubicO group peptidase (beta-lactamase class C family)